MIRRLSRLISHNVISALHFWLMRVYLFIVANCRSVVRSTRGVSDSKRPIILVEEKPQVVFQRTSSNSHPISRKSESLFDVSLRAKYIRTENFLSEVLDLSDSGISSLISKRESSSDQSEERDRN